MRGFITIATGSEHYYKLARQLLRSCRQCCKEAVPFALLCDCENEYTAEFDYVIIMDHPHKSYLDKLSMFRYTPFEETIFIDADALIINDPSVLWEDFSGASSVSCYGKLYPLGADKGWFRYEHAGRWQEKIQHQIGLHGGIYYFRKCMETQSVFETAIQLAKEYDAYNFKGFMKPADEPVVALSMAIHGCVPVEKEGQIVFVHALYGRLSLSKQGVLLLDGAPCNASVCHFATKNTHCYMYQFMSELVDIRYRDPDDSRIPNSWRVRKKTLKQDVKIGAKYFMKCQLRRIVPLESVRRLMAKLK